MTTEKIIELVTEYKKILRNKGAESIRENDTPGSLNHLLWMCENLPQLVHDNRIEKAMKMVRIYSGSFLGTGLAIGRRDEATQYAFR